MKNAQIAIFEGNPKYVELFSELLTQEGHSIVGALRTLDSALDFISRPDFGSIVQIALVEDRLNTDFRDGDIITSHIKRIAPHILCINTSVAASIKGADMHLERSSLVLDSIGKIISAIAIPNLEKL